MPSNEAIEYQIEEALVRFGKKFSRASIIIEGFIESVDESSFTCSVNVPTKNPDGSNTDCLYSDVPLKILKESQAGILEIPKVGTDCLLCFRDNNIQRPQLFQVNEVDKYLIKIGSQTLQITTNGFIFNASSVGAVKADILKAQSNKDKAILDALLGVINGTPINEPGNGSPSALQAALTSVLASLQSGTWDTLENDKIKL
jgi:hypothetical protein